MTNTERQAARELLGDIAKIESRLYNLKKNHKDNLEELDDVKGFIEAAINNLISAYHGTTAVMDKEPETLPTKLTLEQYFALIRGAEVVT